MNDTNATVYRQKIWIDCDVGHDDAFMLILAIFSKELQILGISTSYGNSSIVNTTNNTLQILTAVGQYHLPVHKGLAKPFLREPCFAPDIHGWNGLVGTDLLPPPSIAITSDNAILAIKQALGEEEPNSVVLAVTGPMTNIAVLISIFPDVTQKIEEIVIMGGSMSHGNITSSAEFNIFADPESAEAVLSNASLRGKITLIPLDTTHTCVAARPIISAIGEDKSNFRRMCSELLTYLGETYSSIFGFTEGPPIHDPLTVFYILHPEAFQRKFVYVTIARGGDCDGRMICDLHNRSKREANAYVTLSVDVDRFWAAMLAAIDEADTKSLI